MDLSKISVQGGQLALATDVELNRAESELWLAFPLEYRRFITTLGEGVLGGSFVRVCPPWRILGEINEWRDRIRRYWFWDKGRKLLPKERALESVILADTLNGDELVFHPLRPDRFFVLPRDGEKVFEVKGTFLDALEWMCRSGKLTEPFEDRNFEPFDSRKRPSAHVAGRKTQIVECLLEEAITSLQTWADRLGLGDIAKHECKKWLAQEEEVFYGNEMKIIEKGKVKVDFRDHALVFQPEKYQEPQVVTTLRLIDSDTGFEFGLYRWFTSIGGERSEGWQLYKSVAEALTRFLRTGK